jgi:cytochrome b6-f complex iron-sulfur subunit
MPLIDDLAYEPSRHELDRRKLLGLIGSGALGAAMAGTAIVSVQFVRPNVLYEAGARVKVGRPEDFRVGDVRLLAAQKVIVLRNAKGIVALSATCTHLGCMTRFEPTEGRIFCPCHGSSFDLEGKVTGGPAPKPLPRLMVSLESGALTVDTRASAPADFVLEV